MKVAERVAEKYGCKIGDEVGYHFRGKFHISPTEGKIKVF